MLIFSRYTWWVGAMLGFDEQIETGEAAVGRRVGQDDDLARPSRRSGVD